MPVWLDRLLGRARSPMSLGERGERFAAQFLKRLGYRILVTNYRTRGGEIDIIALDGEVLVFVEVKTREHDEPMPEEQVNAHKQRQVTRAAETYLARYDDPVPPARFDIVAVLWPECGEPAVRHTIDAFEAADFRRR